MTSDESMAVKDLLLTDIRIPFDKRTTVPALAAFFRKVVLEELKNCHNFYKKQAENIKYEFNRASDTELFVKIDDVLDDAQSRRMCSSLFTHPLKNFISQNANVSNS